MKVQGRTVLGAAGAAIALALTLAPATGAPGGTRPAKSRVLLNARGGIGSFTPAATDGRLAAALGRAGLASSGFRFTPASAVRLNRSVTVAVRSRSSGGRTANDRVALVTAPPASITPVAYNLGVAVGWRRFAISGDVAKLDLGALGEREALDVGVSYNANRWSGRVKVGADRPVGLTPRAVADPETYSLDVGGSYALTRNLDVTAGVRYRADRDRLLQRDDDRRDSQAAYIGTAIRF